MTHEDITKVKLSAQSKTAAQIEKHLAKAEFDEANRLLHNFGADVVGDIILDICAHNQCWEYIVPWALQRGAVFWVRNDQKEIDE